MTNAAYETATLVPVISGWGDPASEHYDPERHELVAWYAHYLMARFCPWLLRGLSQCGGSVVVGPGAFFVWIDDDNVHRSIELSALMNVLPWAERGETMH